jgi:alpha-tubulin suppressor-like RCC1 family protein
VYSFGRNYDGCLGIGIDSNDENKSTPQKINFEDNDKISNIFTGCCSCGSFFYSSFKFKKIKNKK